MSHILPHNRELEARKHVRIHGTTTKPLDAIIQLLLDHRDHSLRVKVGKLEVHKLRCKRDLSERQSATWTADHVEADLRGSGGPFAFFFGNGTEKKPDEDSSGDIGARSSRVSIVTWATDTG